jgi:hypothetical protein
VSGLLRVLAFVALLSLVLGAAAAFGRAIGPLERGVEDEGHAESAEDAHPVGLSVAANGFRIVAPRTRIAPGQNARFTFRVLGARTFEPSHERLMHLIVVRRDLDYFRHLHPVRARDGSWATALTLPAPGAYRVFADFVADGKRTVLGLDLFAPGEWLPGRSATAGTGPNTVALDRDGERLRFQVTRAGREVTVDRYLGARGHLVVLRKGDLAYVHTHAEEDELAFEAPLPSPGSYRAYLQFSVGGRVFTKAFPLEER